jgi:hypothetical protein
MSKEKTDKPNKPDEEKEKILDLRKRVVRADNAYRCCKGGKLQAERICLDLKEVVERIAKGNKPKESGFAELVPLESAVVSIVKFVRPAAFPAMPWTMEVFSPNVKPAIELKDLPQGWSDVKEFECASIGLALDLAAEIIQKTKEDCMKCVEKSALGQKAPRKRRTFYGGGTILRRQPGGSKP